MKLISFFLCGSIFGFILLTAPMTVISADALAEETQAKASTLEQLREQRKTAAHRKRRILYNNDGCDSIAYGKEATPQSLLNQRTTALLNSHVDTILYCTTRSFGMYSHRTKVGEIFTCKGDKRPNNITQELLDQGTDPLEIVVNFCKQKGIEAFWSVRMNDTHDSYGYTELMPQLKKDHPEWLMGTEKNLPKFGRWTSVDYGQAEIRDLAFRYIEEVCQNYNVDGVEMDFWRMPCFFRSHSEGGECTQEERDKMTELVRRVRHMSEQEGLKRGRPFLVAIRVPDSVEYCRAIGLDIERWMKEGLVDLLVVSGYYRLNPWEVSVALGHKYDVPVYPCLSNAWMRGEEQKVRYSLENYRARALNVWDSGADGVYAFNIFPEDDGCVILPPEWCHQLGDPEVLRTLDKVYLTGTRGVNGLYDNINKRLSDGMRFLNRRPVNPYYPLLMRPGEAASCNVRVGEDLRNRKSEDAQPQVELHLWISQLASPNDLAVKLNDQLITEGTKSGKWIKYAVDPAYVKHGVNRLEFTVKPHISGEIKLEDLLLWVRYK